MSEAHPIVSDRRSLSLAGLLIALLLVTTWHVTRLPRFAEQPALSAAVTVDLLVTMPLIFAFMVARPRRWPVTTVGAVWGGALAIGHWMIPLAQQRYLGWASHGLVLLEVVSVTLMVVNVRRLVRAYAVARQRGPDFVDNLSAAFAAVFRWPTGFLVSEFAMVRYGLFSWRAKPEVALGQRAFSVDRESGFRGLLATLVGLTVIETTVVHLVVRHWSASAALALTAVSAYGVVFLVAHGRAVALRPVTLTADRLCLRVGFLWRVTVPVADVVRVEEIADAPTPDEQTLDMARLLLTAPNLALSFAAPVVVTGMYGVRRAATRITLYVDDRAGLLDAVRRASSLA